jgi:hypothetical protein
MTIQIVGCRLSVVGFIQGSNVAMPSGLAFEPIECTEPLGLEFLVCLGARCSWRVKSSAPLPVLDEALQRKRRVETSGRQYVIENVSADPLLPN